MCAVEQDSQTAIQSRLQEVKTMHSNKCLFSNKLDVHGNKQTKQTYNKLIQQSTLTSVATKIEGLCNESKCTPIKPPEPAFSQKYALILANSCISILYPTLISAVYVSVFFGSSNENKDWCF